ncbi:MAG: hypothetical protein RPU34_05710 [Candidatus Sedimenticola sp. (ex Thyasira tokunagai)]
MYIDPEEVFREIEKRRAAGLLPDDINDKVDYDNQAKEVMFKLKQSLGCVEMSDEKFFSLYRKVANANTGQRKQVE